VTWRRVPKYLTSTASLAPFVLLGVFLITSASCDSTDDEGTGGSAATGGSTATGGSAATGGSTGTGGAGGDPMVGGGGGGLCVPGPDSLICADALSISLCTEDTDFDGQSDGPATTVEIACTEFFSNFGAASCEAFDDTTAEALCTMDDGGPCGVLLVTGQPTSVRCTTDDAVCMLDLGVENYVCTPNTGITCDAASFQPFCSGELAVWSCTDDGDGIGQPRIDDCVALGNGSCNDADASCIDIELGGRCNLTEWHCAAGLKCEADACVVDPG